MTLVDILFLADDSDTFSTTCSNRLHNVHILEVVYFSVNAPALIVFWHDVSGWTDIESFAVKTPHALYISPHIVFSTDCPRACKVVDVLIRIQILKPALLEEASPCNIPVRAGHVAEACHFKRVHNTVVGVGRLRYLETRSLIWL